MTFLNEQKHLIHLLYWFKLEISHVYGAGVCSLTANASQHSLTDALWLQSVNVMVSTYKIGEFAIPDKTKWVNFSKGLTDSELQELPDNSCVHKSFSYAITMFYLFINFHFVLCSIYVCERLLSIKSLGLASGMKAWITFEITRGEGVWNRLLWRQLTYHNLWTCNAIIAAP